MFYFMKGNVYTGCSLNWDPFETLITQRKIIKMTENNFFSNPEDHTFLWLCLYSCYEKGGFCILSLIICRLYDIGKMEEIRQNSQLD